MKYDNIDPRSKLHDGEPFFFIRAQDALSTKLLVAYMALCRDQGLMDNVISLENVYEEFVAWQQLNLDKVKLPD